MDVADIVWLNTAEGQVATAEAASLLETGSELTALRKLQRRYPAAQARAAIALIRGREVLAGKLSDATRLFCDREAAEQTSHELVARHLAGRFADTGYVADLGCGMGGDALAIAAHARVLGIDRDPARLAMMDANAEARGVAKSITTLAADLADWTPPPDVEAIWADPARRDAAGRQLRPEAWSPPLARVLDLTSMVRGAGIKLAPGIDLDLLPRDAEVEFVSLDRGLRTAVLWYGVLSKSPRTATVLRAGVSLHGEPDRGTTPLGEPGRYLYDPDPSVGRAGLVDVLAKQLGAWKLDEQIAYLSSDVAVETPFARRFLVWSWFPFSERRLREELRAIGADRVEVMRRGSPVDTNALERRLAAVLRPPASSKTALVVVLTRLRGQHVALLCEREQPSGGS